ncbi:MAG TPA: hypothetical protein VFE36_07605 [Candidatus Baltobacteraceae bacterium]|jgi:hypothetical protein|nr:hypothetical protein [Candidatus Baltobacteraceae bacterium]
MHFVRPFVVASSLAVAGLLFAGCAGSTASYGPSQPNASSSLVQSPAAKAIVRAWSVNMMRVPLPHAGCFQAVYPASTWSHVACVATPHVVLPPRKRGRINPAIIGNGNDYGIDVLPVTMLGAIGSFEDVSGITSVTSCAPHYASGNSCGTHGLGNNVYSLQLNSNDFSTAACGNRKNCLGWEQFVYTNQPKYYGGGGLLIIQDWLLSTGTKALKCPANAGWTASGGDCYKNAPSSISVPNVPGSQLGDVRLAGSAGSQGDSVFFSVGGYVYGMKNAQDDGVTDLSDHWTGAEFNVIGNSNGNQAVFNAGAKLTVRLQAVTGYSTAAACRSNAGTTAEENNLFFIAPPSHAGAEQYPSIVFSESNAAYRPGPASCVSVAGR